MENMKFLQARDSMMAYMLAQGFTKEEIKQMDKKEFCKVHNLTKDSSIEELQKALKELMA